MQFDTSKGAQYANQLMSRGDFKALIAHYRMRGINGYQALDSGVQGYTPTQFAQDAKDGWGLTAMDNIFKGKRRSLGDLGHRRQG
ncbi:MAG: hypothetical protein QM813_05835 [Verrucomicrobiota bacterium]